MNKVWRIWKYALGSFEDTKTARFDNAVCVTRSVILLTYLVTNCFITAGVIRHWGDGHESGTPVPASISVSAMIGTSERNYDNQR